MKRALVLSGGGSRGAYQYGVWKALRKLHIKIDIVTGTSIGALNGFLIVQKDYKKGLNLWNTLSFSSVFDNAIDVDYKKIHIFKEYIKAFIKNGGMDINALEKIVRGCVDINKFYKSKINFGLVTFKLNTLTPVLLTKKEIDKNLLVDYLIASATCYPAFKTKKIGNDVYIDGGYYDNLPINLAVDMGADEMIAVDLFPIGTKRKIKKKKNITYISSRNKLGNPLMFNKEEAKRQINLGYNDTFKTYKKLLGNKYTFYKYTLPYINFLYRQRYIKNILSNVKHKTKIGNFIKNIQYKEINNILESMEYLAYIFNLDETIIYTPWRFNKEIKKRFNTLEEININNIKSSIKNRKIKDLITLKSFIKYIHSLIKNKKINDLTTISTIFQREFMAAMYLYTIKK